MAVYNKSSKDRLRSYSVFAFVNHDKKVCQINSIASSSMVEKARKIFYNPNFLLTNMLNENKLTVNDLQLYEFEKRVLKKIQSYDLTVAYIMKLEDLGYKVYQSDTQNEMKDNDYVLRFYDKLKDDVFGNEKDVIKVWQNKIVNKSNKKSIRVNVSFDDYVLLNDKAEKFGLSMSEFVRQSCLYDSYLLKVNVAPYEKEVSEIRDMINTVKRLSMKQFNNTELNRFELNAINNTLKELSKRVDKLQLELYDVEDNLQIDKELITGDCDDCKDVEY